MPAVTTEGLILKRRSFGEADRVLTVLTDRFGKISIIAKGVRKITSRRAGNIEILNRVKLHLFKAKNYTLTEAESIETFDKIKKNLILTSSAFHIIELVDRLTPEEQRNPQLYALVVSALTLLQENPRQLFLRAFEVKILSMLGFWSSQATQDLDPSTSDLLQKLETLPWEQIANLIVNHEQTLALEDYLRYYSEEVLEGSLKSLKVFKQFKS